MITRRSAILTTLLVLGVFWAPLPFASVTPQGELVLELVAFISLALALRVPNNSGRLTAPRVVALLLAALAALAWLQSLPLPTWLLHWVSPASAGYQEAAASLLGKGVEISRAVSLAPAASRSTALALLAWGAALYAAAVAARHRWQRRALAAAVLLAALFQIFYGAQHWFAHSLTIWGVLVPGTPRQLRGTYVNPDHLAYLLEAALAIAFAGLVWAVQRARREIGIEWRLFWVAPWVLLWPLLFAGLAFTGSRGGLAAALVAIVGQTALVALEQRKWKLWALGLVASAGGLAVVAWLGFEAGFGRWMQLSPYALTWNARFAVAHGTLELWRRFPVFGTGLGSFRAAFPLVEAKAQTVSSWSHAHNDFLELLTTGGVVAVALLAAVLWVSLRRLFRLLMNRLQRSENRAAALAALGLVLSLAAHELVDFGLSLPANAFIAAVLLGAALGIPVPKREEPRDEFRRAGNGDRRRSKTEA